MKKTDDFQARLKELRDRYTESLPGKMADIKEQQKVLDEKWLLEQTKKDLIKAGILLESDKIEVEYVANLTLTAAPCRTGLTGQFTSVCHA